MKKLLSVGSVLLLFFCACSKIVPEALPQTQQQQPVSTPPDSTKQPLPPADTTHKVDTTAHKVDTTHTVPFPVTATTTAPSPGCPLSPIYGDTIIYTQPNGGADYIFSPVNNPGPGKYFSWPQGMVIDQNTGAINLTRSETGLKYAIGFVRAGSTDTCLSTLVVGGAAYADSIYVLNTGATAALPYFDANPYLPSICANNACTFDVTGSAASQKVIINTATGVIDLQKTLNGTLLGLGGVFGLIPVNGQVVTTNIYYKLKDASNSALQHISVQLVYFDSKSNMSPGLLTGIVNKLDNLLSGHMISTMANPRPPLIVITRRL